MKLTAPTQIKSATVSKVPTGGSKYSQSSAPKDLTINVLAHNLNTTAQKLMTAKQIATELTVEPCDSVMVAKTNEKRLYESEKSQLMQNLQRVKWKNPSNPN